MLSIPQQVRALMKRRVQIIRGNMTVTFIRLLSVYFLISFWRPLTIHSFQCQCLSGSHHGQCIFEDAREYTKFLFAGWHPVFVRVMFLDTFGILKDTPQQLSTLLRFDGLG
jgi:hypothetical protein